MKRTITFNIKGVDSVHDIAVQQLRAYAYEYYNTMKPVKELSVALEVGLNNGDISLELVGNNTFDKNIEERNDE